MEVLDWGRRMGVRVAEEDRGLGFQGSPGPRQLTGQDEEKGHQERYDRQRAAARAEAENNGTEDDDQDGDREDPAATAQAEDQVQRRLLLDVVVRQRAPWCRRHRNQYKTREQGGQRALDVRAMPPGRMRACQKAELTILELLSCKNKPLLVWRDSLLVLGVTSLHSQHEEHTE